MPSIDEYAKVRPFFESVQKITGGMWGHAGGGTMALTSQIGRDTLLVDEDSLGLYRGNKYEDLEGRNLVCILDFYDHKDKRLGKKKILQLVQQIVREAPSLLKSRAAKGPDKGRWYWSLSPDGTYEQKGQKAHFLPCERPRVW